MSMNRASKIASGVVAPCDGRRHANRRPGRIGGIGGQQAVRLGRSGAAAAEFAIVLPILVGLLFGTVEFGLLLFSYSSMQSALRDVTRQVAVNTISVATAENSIRARLPGWMRQDAVITINQTTPGNPATNVYTGSVSVIANQATPLSFYTRASDWSMQTTMEMKQELPFI